jgi:peptidoglycan/xylan/chitin deacetylase (PgdA/CDA1 family)
MPRSMLPPRRALKAPPIGAFTLPFSIFGVKRSWNWDFEDEPRAKTRPERTQVVAAPPKTQVRVEIRRRRGALLLVLALILVALLVSLLGSGHHASTSASRAAAARTSGNGAAAGGSAQTTATGNPVKGVLAYTPFVAAGGARGRDVALTFDDGPGPYTPQVLSMLESTHVPATFFAIGKMERYFSASTQREVRDGDVVGDHTQSHLPLATLSVREQHEQLFEGIARVELAGGPRPELFRPPYGSFNEATLRELHSLGLLMVLWSVDTNDYLQPGVQTIVERVLAGARPGAIFLLHDGGGDRSQTVAALPQIIRDLRARGYTLVTIPQLLRDDPPPAGLPIPHSLAGD